MAAAAALQCASALLSWYFAACGAMAAADALFVAGHIMAALGIGGALHISWDLMLAAAGAMKAAMRRWLKFMGRSRSMEIVQLKACALDRRNTRTTSASRLAWSFRLSAAAALSSTSAAFCCVIWSSCVTAALTWPMPWDCSWAAVVMSLMKGKH